MIKTTRGLSILPLAAMLLLGMLLQGCALKPKPSELEALEKLRASPSAAAALKLKNAASLVKSSDELLKRAQAKWKSSDLDESTDAALMGQAKLKHAIALADQEAAKARIAKAEDDLDDLAEEQAKVQKDLDAANETIGLLNQTAQAKEEQKAMEVQMEADKKMAADKSDTADKISAAELALKTADTVQASTYAKAEYTAASDTLARAQAELQQGNFRGAQMSADIARKKAEEAVATAQPIYAEKTKADDNRARADTLTREASTIAGVEVRRDARGVSAADRAHDSGGAALHQEAERDHAGPGGHARPDRDPDEEEGVPELPSADRGFCRSARKLEFTSAADPGPGTVGGDRADVTRGGQQAGHGHRPGRCRADFWRQGPQPQQPHRDHLPLSVGGRAGTRVGATRGRPRRGRPAPNRLADRRAASGSRGRERGRERVRVRNAGGGKRAQGRIFVRLHMGPSYVLHQLRLREPADKPGCWQGGPRTGPECTAVLEDRKRRPDAASGPDRRPSINRRVDLAISPGSPGFVGEVEPRKDFCCQQRALPLALGQPGASVAQRHFMHADILRWACRRPCPPCVRSEASTNRTSSLVIPGEVALVETRFSVRRTGSPFPPAARAARPR